MLHTTRGLALLTALVLALALVLAGCGPGTETGGGPSNGGGESTGTGGGGDKGPVTVGSKLDTEGSILGQIIIAVLEDEGFKVTDKTRTGTTDVVRKALLSGEIDVYPEYTGSALTQFFKGETIDPATSKDATKSYDTVKRLDAEKNQVVWGRRAPADNTWAIAIPKRLSTEQDITTLEDWARYINSGALVKVIGSQEFFERADAFPAFEKAYGFKLDPGQKTALATGDTAVTEKAASGGTDGVNAAMAYGTDGTISALGLVVLKDTKGVQPVYQPAPTFRKAVIDRYPEAAGSLDPVFAKLTLETLQELNGQVAVEGKDAKTVARDWLEQEGLLK